jgi:creatinine amidohydrolase
MPNSEPWRYEKRTWPEINEAVQAKKIVVVPIGSIEQHGAHLPLDVDVVCPVGVAEEAARAVPNKVLVMPPIVHGYTAHVMDFPGTINIHYDHFIRMIMDVGKSLAYHGFKKIILLNGHGSNWPNLDLASRRINLETDAECCALCWWSLIAVDKEFYASWRESKFPGGCAHAGELETSMYMYLDGDNVREDKISDGDIEYNKHKSDFFWTDLIAAGPAQVTSWTAGYSDSGVLGEATLATKEKGERAVKESGRQLARWIEEFGSAPKPPRGDHHVNKPTMTMPWNQTEPPSGMGNVHG